MTGSSPKASRRRVRARGAAGDERRGADQQHPGEEPRPRARPGRVPLGAGQGRAAAVDEQRDREGRDRAAPGIVRAHDPERSQAVLVPCERVAAADAAPAHRARRDGVRGGDDAHARRGRRGEVGLDAVRREAQERLAQEAEDDDDARRRRRGARGAGRRRAARARSPETAGRNLAMRASKSVDGTPDLRRAAADGTAVSPAASARERGTRGRRTPCSPLAGRAPARLAVAAQDQRAAADAGHDHHRRGDQRQRQARRRSRRRSRSCARPRPRARAARRRPRR